jgi:hypothetical protein
MAAPVKNASAHRPDIHWLMNLMCANGFTIAFCTSAIAAALLLGASPAAAQSTQPPVDDEFARLAQKLKVGESIVVTTDTGVEIRGRFLNVSAAAIGLHVNHVDQQLPASQVSRIQVRRNGVLLGALIGAGTGIPFGLALKSWAHNEGGNEAWAVAFPTLVGLGTGIAIDAFLVIPRTVFDRLSPVRARLVPVVTPQKTALRIAISF